MRSSSRAIHRSGADLCASLVPSCRDGAGMQRDRGTGWETPLPPPTLPAAWPRCTHTPSTPGPCTAQREERLKDGTNRGYAWGICIFFLILQCTQMNYACPSPKVMKDRGVEGGNQTPSYSPCAAQTEQVRRGNLLYITSRTNSDRGEG